MRMQILSTLVLTVCFFPAVAHTQYIPNPGEDYLHVMLNDPVGAELIAYDEAVNEFRKLDDPSPFARLAHYQEWRDRFRKVIGENPHAKFVWEAKSKLLSLYNGLEEFDKSQALLQELIADAKTTDEKIRWQNQLGTVSRLRHQGTQEQRDFQMSQEAFEKAHELYLSLSSEKQSGYAGGNQIVALCTAATTARESNDHEKSATLFRSARELFQSSPESAMYAVSVGYGLEIITELEMNQWIILKRDAESLKCLEILSTLPVSRWPPSYYAQQYAERRYENINDSTGFQNFVSQWLDENAVDERTPILTARLAFSYFRDGQYDKALPIHETLREKHMADFRRLEPDAFRNGRGGHYESILLNLNQIYLHQGDMDRADRMKTELINLLPESPFTRAWSEPEFSEDQPEYQPPKQASYLLLRIFLVIVGIIMILWGLYLARSKERKK